MMAPSISSRGWGRVTSQTEIATRCPRLIRSLSGGPATGWPIALRRTAVGWRAADLGRGAITVVADAGSRTVSPADP